MISPPVSQSTILFYFTQSAPLSRTKTKKNHQITIKIKSEEVIDRHRKQTLKNLYAFIETRLRVYSALKNAQIEVATQLKSENIHLLIKTRRDAETLKSIKKAKK